MGKKLIAYFSASGVTAGVAKTLAEITGAHLYEIKPKVPYTKGDLNWLNPFSRSTKEMKNKSSRPEIVDADANIAGYDTIFLGFPIWWYIAPTIVNTFLESNHFEGQTIILFATSGSSDFGETLAHLKGSCPGAIMKEGRVFRRKTSKETIAAWVESL